MLKIKYTQFDDRDMNEAELLIPLTYFKIYDSDIGESHHEKEGKRRKLQSSNRKKHFFCDKCNLHFCIQKEHNCFVKEKKVRGVYLTPFLLTLFTLNRESYVMLRKIDFEISTEIHVLGSHDTEKLGILKTSVRLRTTLGRKPYVRFLPKWIFPGRSASTQDASILNLHQNLREPYMKPSGHFQNFVKNGSKFFFKFL